jgi:hypothetical protein
MPRQPSQPLEKQLETSASTSLLPLYSIANWELPDSAKTRLEALVQPGRPENVSWPRRQVGTGL